MPEPRPLGPVVDPSPAREPGGVTLRGRCGAVERLEAARHGADLWQAMGAADEIWTYLSYGPFANAAAFGAWLSERAKLKDPFYYVVVDASGHALGLATLLNIRPADRVIEVGHIVYGPALQRTPLATEAQYLLACYAFETLGYRRYEWRCNALNQSSRRAALRFGFSFEGVFRQHMIVKGRNRDTAWFSMLDSEWPARKMAFQAWLRPDNFDAQGRQKKSLRDCTDGPSAASRPTP